MMQANYYHGVDEECACTCEAAEIMNLDQLETFLAVAGTGSFTKAAPLVHRTQSAVSRQIQELERSLGLPLFERLGKQISLTEAGRLLVADAPQLLLQVDNLRGLLRDIAEGVTGELRIGATVSAATTFMPDVLAKFRRRHPTVGLSLAPGQTDAMFGMLRKNEIDFAVVGSEPPGDDVAVRFRIPDELVLVASPDHPLAGKKTVKPSDLEGVEFLFREEGSDCRVLVERWLEQHRVSVRTLMNLW